MPLNYENQGQSTQNLLNIHYKHLEKNKVHNKRYLITLNRGYNLAI
jgi:hypothetical protein